jgi:hypothetical protein
MVFDNFLAAIPRISIIVRVFGHDVELNWATLGGTAAVLFTVSRFFKWVSGRKVSTSAFRGLVTQI